MQRRLAADGIMRIGQLAALDQRELARRYGRLGLRLAQLARGEDSRRIHPAPRRLDLGRDHLAARRGRCGGAGARCGRSARMWQPGSSRPGLAPPDVTLKLKTADFRLRTRSRRLADPTQLADSLFPTARDLLAARLTAPRGFA